MKKFLGCLVIMSSQISSAGGSHLIALRESGEVDFREPVKESFLQEKPRFSVPVARELLNRLHSSEEHQVVAAWLQLTLLKEKRHVFDQLKRSDRWIDRGERVNKLVQLLELAPASEKSLLDFYTISFKKTDFDNRCVPGCGNMRQVFLSPERLAHRVKLGF